MFVRCRVFFFLRSRMFVRCGVILMFVRWGIFFEITNVC